jgi:uncharacterized protein (DUF1810 family)
MQNPIDLRRFEAREEDFARALGEIESGRKRSHWMWYVFPQVAGLGNSEMSRQYAISSVTEAESFLLHPSLGPAYRQIVDAVWEQVVDRGQTIRGLFGSPDDAKLVSSLTLFADIAKRLLTPSADIAEFITHAEEILEAAYTQGLDRCTRTEQFFLR